MLIGERALMCEWPRFARKATSINVLGSGLFMESRQAYHECQRSADAAHQAHGGRLR